MFVSSQSPGTVFRRRLWPFLSLLVYNYDNQLFFVAQRISSEHPNFIATLTYPKRSLLFSISTCPWGRPAYLNLCVIFSSDKQGSLQHSIMMKCDCQFTFALRMGSHGIFFPVALHRLVGLCPFSHGRISMRTKHVPGCDQCNIDLLYHGLHSVTGVSLCHTRMA